MEQTHHQAVAELQTQDLAAVAAVTTALQVTPEALEALEF
jgi:hypothetical protein